MEPMIKSLEDIRVASRPSDNLNSAHSFWHSLIREMHFTENLKVIHGDISTLREKYDFMKFLIINDNFFNSKGIVKTKIITPPQEDGNPILNCFLPMQNRCVRIINLPSKNAGLQLGMWTAKAYGHHTNGELVLALELNKTSFQLASVLIYIWIAAMPERTFMDEFLDVFWSELVQDKPNDVNYFQTN